MASQLFQEQSSVKDAHTIKPTHIYGIQEQQLDSMAYPEL